MAVPPNVAGKTERESQQKYIGKQPDSMTRERVVWASHDRIAGSSCVQPERGSWRLILGHNPVFMREFSIKGLTSRMDSRG